MVFGLTDCCVIGRKKNPLENNIFFTTDHVFNYDFVCTIFTHSFLTPTAR